MSWFNLVSAVSDTETALDLIAVLEAGLKEIVEMKARRFRNFVGRPRC
jgi:hypothetical protein